ncbi:LLM class flavin-dependent oxidoreductase [Streptomyces aidingensis]|uniref:Flavin-dependent oxidoreductase, luciferase family (Includes alkanesulfonate monooxygenase SsuD and methylene tetrahydromethanopterin reductase) n=1 Tax=Streptomyces aidingensis TaxID=910347 RepID=A0A1I1T497_9ACTN|nr:LLM class flavin-dependent oxidoreductase [Streptomyces aidingensis]SFD50150.1 Flavin-dependent oxidoreductase, luciferase family (includes alkanesulfonate monooxygenase SsuD and methylene tetrahydromethanopterin reductase) [Streptomyces aidingensis]
MHAEAFRVGTFILAGQFPDQGHEEALERAVAAALATEEAGLDAVWLAEHHFVPYGTCPSGVTLAGYLLGRTRRIGVGTAISVLPNTHPVALGEQAALLHLASRGRFTLGVGRGGPWIDLEVFGGGLDALEKHFPESLDLLLRWLREPEVGAEGERYRFRPVAVVPRAAECGAPPPVIVACTSPATVRHAARRGLPMLLGMHVGDREKAEMVALWRTAALEAGVSPDRVETIGHVSAGVVQIADSQSEAVETLRRSLPGWLRLGLGAHRTVDGRARTMRDPLAYTEQLCELHPVGPPRLCADRLAATAERTGIRRFALLAEGSGHREVTEDNVRRLGLEVMPLLAGGRAGEAGGGSAKVPGMSAPGPSVERRTQAAAAVLSSHAAPVTG